MEEEFRLKSNAEIAARLIGRAGLHLSLLSESERTLRPSESRTENWEVLTTDQRRHLSFTYWRMQAGLCSEDL